jgi:predicted acyltransferase
MTPLDPKSRLVSLDAFRGAAIAAMVLVNNPGSYVEVYQQLEHSEWHGLTFTDCVFPAFLWIVGVAITLSFARRVEQGSNRGQLLFHVLRRSVIIFALGIFINNFPFGLFLDPHFSLAAMRIPGVLQRIAVCYLFAAMIFFSTRVRGQVLWTLGLLLVYWLLVNWVYVPGYGEGILEPEGNLCWYIDSLVLRKHTWRGAMVEGFDPEGIVSTITAVATTLFGVLAGHWLRAPRSGQIKALGLLGAGLALIVIGVIMDHWLPINKNLWTSSFTVCTAGVSSVCLAIFFWLMDVKGYQRWAKPFEIFGMNALAIYVLSVLTARLLYLFGWWQEGGYYLELREYLFQILFEPWASTIFASLMYAVAYVLVMYLVAWAMWKRRVFIKL